MSLEEKEKYLQTPQTIVLEKITPSEMEFVRHILQEQFNPARDILPTVFDFMQKQDDNSEELICSYVMVESKTRKTIKRVSGKERAKYLKNEKEKAPNKKKPVRKSVSK